MRTSRIIISSAVLTLGLPTPQAMAADGWGASWSFGPVHPTATNHIIHTKTTLVPGRRPMLPNNAGPLFLWPGISNPKSDLVQTTMDDWSGNENSSYCSGNGSQWCVEASVFNGGQINGPTVAIDPDDHVTIEYGLGSDAKTWTQTVTSQKLGKVVSTLQSASGPMDGGGFGFATEADADSYTIDTEYYLCTEAHLAAADPDFGATGVGGNGAQYGATGKGSGPGTAQNLRTPDNGLTWLVDLITLPAMQPQGTQTPPPKIDCGTSGAGDGGGSSGSSGGGTSGSSGNSGSSGSTSGNASGSTSGNASGSTSGNASGGASGSTSGGASEGGTDALDSGAPSTGNGGSLADSGASNSGATSPNSAADGPGAGGCGCALVGANTETNAALSTIALGLAATFVRRRRTTRKE